MSEKLQRQIRCVVTSDKMQKSRVGMLERLVKHPVAGKFVKKTTKIMFHDEKNLSQCGDEVVIVQTRPRSKRKAFELHEIVKKHVE